MKTRQDTLVLPGDSAYTSKHACENMETTPDSSSTLPPYRISIAPMIGHTDKFFHQLIRLMSKKTYLYTEMIHDTIITNKHAHQNLEIDRSESPVILQLGGEDPSLMLKAALRGQDLGFDEININAGCPSKKLRKRKFGIYLMDDVERCCTMLELLHEHLNIPVSIKYRIGYDGTKYKLAHKEDYKFLRDFTRRCIQAGASRISVHARIAIIGGINSELNRTIPPLKYDMVYMLAEDIQEVPIEINGNITNLSEALSHLHHVDAVMIGRSAVSNPLMFHCADEVFSSHEDTAREILEKYEREEYIKSTLYPYALDIVRQYKNYLMQQVSLARDKKYLEYTHKTIRHLLSFFDIFGDKIGVPWSANLKKSLSTLAPPDIAIGSALKCIAQSSL